MYTAAMNEPAKGKRQQYNVALPNADSLEKAKLLTTTLTAVLGVRVSRASAVDLAITETLAKYEAKAKGGAA